MFCILVNRKAGAVKKSFLYFVVLMCCLLLASCAVSDNTPNEEPNTGQVASLSGNWRWVRSTGSIAGITVTPENSGKTMEITFTADNIFNKYVDNQLVYTSPFELGQKDSTIQFTTLALFESVGLGFDHQVEQEFRIVADNTLLLIDPCCDNFTFEFVK